MSAPKTSYYDRSPDELVGRFIRTTYRVKRAISLAARRFHERFGFDDAVGTD